MRKYWGEIDTTLYEGDILTVTVINQFNTYRFGGEKWLVISNNGAAQSINSTFGIAWLAMGFVGLIVNVLYIVYGRERFRVSRNPEMKKKFLAAKLSWHNHRM